jgi:hypothetical protein
LKQTKKNKLIGQFVTEKLSGKKAIVVEKKKKGVYTIRVWVVENCNWLVMDCPKSQIEKGFEEPKKMGYK